MADKSFHMQRSCGYKLKLFELWKYGNFRHYSDVIAKFNIEPLGETLGVMMFDNIVFIIEPNEE